MLWDEYVEDITENLRSRRRAREVRGEVRDHLMCLKEQFVSEGMIPEEAEKKAMDMLGPVDVLAQRFRELERPLRPLWPAAVTGVGVLWAVGALGMPDWGQAGIAALLLVWAVLWGIVHLRSFPSLLVRLRSDRPVTLGIPWDGLFPAAWPYLGAGAVFGVTFPLLCSPNLANLGFFGFLVAVAAGVAAFAAAGRYPWFSASGSSLHHPLTSGLAAVAVLTTLILVMTVLPASNIYDPTYGFPGMHVSYGSAVHVSFAFAVPTAGLFSALYFSVCTATRWVADRLTVLGASPQDVTLTLK